MNIKHLLACFFLVTANLQYSFSSEREKLMKTVEQITQSDLVGIQYRVLSKDRVLFQYEGGFSSLSKKTTMDENTLMQTASMSKVFTAVALLQLEEKELLSINAPLSRYYQNHPYGDQVTLRQLLNHTSGVPNPLPLKWAHLRAEHSSFQENKKLNQILKENPSLDQTPGTEYEYSNLGYWILGKVVEEVSGQDFSNYVTENILKPLQIQNDSFYTLPKNQEVATGYLAKYSFFNLIKNWLSDKKFFGEYRENWLEIRDFYQDGPAFGGLIMNSKAITLFLQDQLGGMSKLLGKNAITRLYEQQNLKNGESVSMALGWHLGEVDGEAYYFKEGGAPGFHSEMRLYPQRGIGSFVMVNRTSFSTKKNLDQWDQNFLKSDQ